MVSLTPVEGGLVRVLFSVTAENFDTDAIEQRVDRDTTKWRLDCSPLCSSSDPNRETLDSLFDSFVKEPCYLNDTTGSAVGNVLALTGQSKRDDILQLFAKPRTTRCGFRVKPDSDQRLLVTYIGLYRQPADDDLLLQCIAYHWMQIYINCRRHPGHFNQYIFNMSAEVTPPSLRNTIFQRIMVDGMKELGGRPSQDVLEPPQQFVVDISYLPLMSAIITSLRLEKYIRGCPGSGNA